MTDWVPSLLTHPALDSVRPYAERLQAHDAWPSVAELDALLRDRLAIEPAVALEPQGPKRRRRGRPLDRASLYVVRIHDARRIPTRERSWHDLLNALVWAAFPESKRALTARQRAITERRVPPGVRSIPGARSREEDALAMLDEGGVAIAVDDARVTEVAAALREGQLAAVAQAIDEGDATAHVFGHALMEHAIAGRTDVRGYAVVLAPGRAVADADAALAGWIARGEELARPEAWRGLALNVIV